MEEKIEELRNKIIHELDGLEDGVHISLDFEPRVIELIIFDTIKTDSSVYKVFGLPKRVLKHIDFSNVSFDKFKASEYDFTGLHNVKLNPQTIHANDLSGSILNGVTFIGLFDNVRLSHTDFTGSTGAVINPRKLYIGEYNYYWDEISYNHLHKCYRINMNDCKFYGVSFIKKIKSFKLGSYVSLGDRIYLTAIPKISGSDFTGSTGAVIYPESIDLNDTILKDTLIVGEVKDVEIKGANFKGATGINFGSKSRIMINPQKIADKDVSNCVFEGVQFTGPFDGAEIEKSDFTGSIGAVINLETIKKLKNKEKVNFSNARVIGYDGSKMSISEDGRIGKDLESMIDKLLGREKESVVLSKRKLEEAKQQLLEESKRKVQEKISELLRLVETTERLGVNPKNLYCSIPIGKEELLVQIDDHYEINRNFVNYLRFLNLSMIDFSNVKVSGLDFRGSGARINPQTVYKKDLSNGIFDASNIKFFDDFTGVNIEGADFTECEVDPKEKIK